MARELALDKKLGIEQLYVSGMSKRQIAKTLGIDRKSVDRYVAWLQSREAAMAEAPTGEALTGPEDSKGAKAPTGSDAEKLPINVDPQPGNTASSSRSHCLSFHEQIVAKIELGLTARRIFQDLVADHGFRAKYHSVRRYVLPAIHT